MCRIAARHLITSEDWSIEDIDIALTLARQLKAGEAIPWVDECLNHKTVFLFFNKPSTRSRLSFHPAVVEMGGVPMLVEEKDIHQKEGWKELSLAMVKYGGAVCIRLLASDGDPYGSGESKLRGMCEASDDIGGPPVISMSHDRCHPCQGMYEYMTFQDELKERALSGRRILYTWVRGSKQAPNSPTHDSLMMATRRGMRATLCHPQGFELAEDVMRICARNAESSGGNFTVTDDLPSASKGQDIVYARHWGPPTRAEELSEWYCDDAVLGEAKFVHPMPIERDVEALATIVDGPQSMLDTLIENKYFLQKAVLALLVRSRQR